jgi:uncharacterized metal-binding protein
LSKALIVPCSGIGKTYGTVAREAAYILTEDLRPETAQLIPLTLVVLGDEEVGKTLLNLPAIAIDGCKLACAANAVAQAGGKVSHAIQVLDVYRRHRELKPDGIAELNENGRRLAEALATEAAELLDQDG